MKKYYKETDVAFSINSNTNQKKINDTITPNGNVLKKFEVPVLTEDGIKEDKFSAYASSYFIGITSFMACEAFATSGSLESNNEWISEYNYASVDNYWGFYNPKPLVVRSIVYYGNAGFRSSKREIGKLIGSNTGEFTGEEELISEFNIKAEITKNRFLIDCSNNNKPFKYHRITWSESTGSAVYHAGNYNVIYVGDLTLDAYELNDDYLSEYAKSINIKQHVVTSVDGKLIVIPEQNYNVSKLSSGKYYVFSNTERRKIELLSGEYIISKTMPKMKENNIIWLDNSTFPLELNYITPDNIIKKNNLVKIGYLEILDGLIIDYCNDMFNEMKAKKKVVISNKYKCGCQNRKAFLPELKNIIYYKYLSEDKRDVVQTDKNDFDFYTIRPNFNISEGGIMCLEGLKNNKYTDIKGD